DDAADEAQVAPLLPGSDTCSVLVTSRSRMTALDGARYVELGALPAAEGVALLTRIVGHDRVAAEPDVAAQLVTRCGGLPLEERDGALRRVMAASLETYPLARGATRGYGRLSR